MRAHSFGLGSLALPWLLSREGLWAAPTKPFTEALKFDLSPKAPPRYGQAKAMISLFMIGGPSQMDLFDPKPQLAKYHLQPFPGEIRYDNAAEASSKVFGSPWKFAPRGQCGMEISELLPHLAEIVDDITLIRSMKTGVNNHGQSVSALHTGRITSGRPTLGSWLSYGLGSASDELPTYLALTSPQGPPLMNNENWTAGWLPAVYQGTMVRPTAPHILNLDAPPDLAGAGQKKAKNEGNRTWKIKNSHCFAVTRWVVALQSASSRWPPIWQVQSLLMRRPSQPRRLPPVGWKKWS